MPARPVIRRRMMRESEKLNRLFERENTELARRLTRGEIDLGTWQITMREQMRRQYALQLIAGAGGDKAKVSDQDWLRLGGELRSQYLYLEKFAREIADGKVVGGSLEMRARMYANSAKQMFWKQASPVALPAYPGDGSTDCIVYCKCQWQIIYERDEFGNVIAVLATWLLDPKEQNHCANCPQRAKLWNPLRIPFAAGKAAKYAFEDKFGVWDIETKVLEGTH